MFLTDKWSVGREGTHEAVDLLYPGWAILFSGEVLGLGLIQW